MTALVIKGKQKMGSARVQKGIKFFVVMLLCMVVLMNFLAITTYAKKIPSYSGSKLAGADKLHSVVGWIAAWAGKIGLVVAFFGALQTVLGFMNDDADAKVRGLKTLAAGFMFWGVSESVNMFFTA